MEKTVVLDGKSSPKTKNYLSIHKKKTRVSDNLLYVLIYLSASISVILLIGIIGYVFAKGISRVSWSFLTSVTSALKGTTGIAGNILNTIYIILLTLLVAAPVGIGSAIYLNEYAKPGKIVKIIEFTTETLSGIPSIVFGLFGLAFFVVFLKLGWCILSGGLVLALMAIPTIFQVAEVTLTSIPNSYKEGSYGLGATKWQVIYSVILPAALPGIITGVILAMTRAISEAAAVMYAVGSALTVPISIFDPGRPLPLHLYVLATEGVSLQNAYGTAAVLVIIVLILTVATNLIVERYQKKIMGK